MTTNEITLPNRPPSPNRIGQATAVEQSRAVAEVYAQVTAARQMPRDIQAARAAMLDACGIAEFAARAFYRYPRGGSTVTGPSVYLARELARCWGNIDHGIKELSRDDEHGQSEMLAFAWDMESNVRSSNVFIVPHKRDKKGGPEPLVDMREIYENNANNGARRVRQAIFSVLPPWFTEAAVAACHDTNRSGGGKPLQERIAAMLARFRELRVTEDDIARKLGRPASKWTGDDVASLIVSYTSIQRGEIDRDEEFPPNTVTAADITNGSSAPTTEPPAVAQHQGPEPAGTAQPATADRAPAALVTKLKEQLAKIGVAEAAEQLYVLRKIAGRQLRTSADITTQEGARAADLFNRALANSEPGRALDALLGEPDGGAQP